jgi:predicted DNA-binding transcriptional regulator AlpA
MSGDVLFIKEVCAELRVSRRTVDRLRRHGAFPIPEMPSLDKRPRWSRAAVESFKASEREHGNTVTRRRGFRTSKPVGLEAR